MGKNRKDSSTTEDAPSLVVGIGASAGGLAALRELIQPLSAKTGMAFFVVQHSDPKHKSNLPEILRPSTALTVVAAEDGSRVRRNFLYIAPNDRDVLLENGIIRLVPRTLSNRPHRSIDTLFSSVAQVYGSNAVGVILSGTGNDGTAGLGAIRAAGGVTFAQDERSAQHFAMPKSAILAGLVDHVLSPAEMARELQALATIGPSARRPGSEKDQEATREILALLHRSLGVDFTDYKQTTLSRRIRKRMAANKLTSLAEYAGLLKAQPSELQELYRDVLINVTRFFRDPDIFDALSKLIFPKITVGRAADDPIRIWVPGCSTGEEVYSLAIALTEFAAKANCRFPIQLFGSDISEPSLERARAGIYPSAISSLVSASRLEEFFEPVEDGYRVRKALRDLCIFARQNVIADPPLSRMDLISCRNLLIYFGPALQERVVPIFHYALKPTNAYLVLGKSELVDIFSDFFVPIDKTNRFYAKKDAPLRASFGPLTERKSFVQTPHPMPVTVRPKRDTELDVQRETDRLILARFSPAGVVVTEHMDIIQFRGRTTPYLNPSGRASFNLFKMLQPDLLQPIRKAIEQASAKETQSVRCRRLRFREAGGFKFVSVRVIPIRSPGLKQRYFLILFRKAKNPDGKSARPETKIIRGKGVEVIHLDETNEVKRLTRELDETREHLQSVLDEREVTVEELQSSNEEVTSSNEELQTVNQELETAKEELESSNEELTALNEQLRQSMVLLKESEERFRLLVSGVKDYAIFMLDLKGYIQSWNEGAERINGYSAEEIIGKHFSIFYPEADKRAGKPEMELRVASDVGRFEEESVRLRKGGKEFLSNVVITALYDENGMPYGYAKVTRDITEKRAAEERLREQDERFRLLVSVVKDYAIFMLDPNGYVKSWNEGAQRIMGYSAQEIMGQHFSKFYSEEDLESHKPDNELRTASTSGRIEDEGWRLRRDGTRFWANTIITAIQGSKGNLVGFTKVTRDLSERKRTEEELQLTVAALREAKSELETKVDERTKELRESNERLSATNAELEQFAYVASHDLQEPLRVVATHLQFVERSAKDRLSEEEKEYFHFAEAGAIRMKALIEDLLAFARIGRAEERFERVDLREIVVEARANLEAAIVESEAEILVGELPSVTADPNQMVQLFQNLIGNAIKYRGPARPKIQIQARPKDGGWLVSVQDNGMGIAPEYLEKIFVIFQRLHSDREKYPGTGIGLSICKKIVERHRGRIWAKSQPGEGSTFYFTLPEGVGDGKTL